jgi:hypothetical protein
VEQHDEQLQGALACHYRLTPKYRQLVADLAASKQVHHLTSRAKMTAFVDAVAREQGLA